MKKEIPLAITFLTGMLLIFALFIPREPFGTLQQRFNDWYIIVVGFTLILGVDSLLAHHFRVIRKGGTQALYSLALILSFLITLIWGIYEGVKIGNPFAPNASFLRYYYTYIMIPLQATMFSLLAFFIASAAYRAFRARTFDASLLLISSGIVMLGNVPQGERAFPIFVIILCALIGAHYFLEAREITETKKRILFISLGLLSLILIYPIIALFTHNLPKIKDWIMNIPHLGAKRGILIGIALGSVAMSVRIILGIERTYLR